MHPVLIQRSKPYFEIIPRIFRSHLSSLPPIGPPVGGSSLCEQIWGDFYVSPPTPKKHPHKSKNTRIGKLVRNRYAYIIKKKYGREDDET